MSIHSGILNTTATESYLGDTLMAMRDTPRGGTLQERIYAARAYFADSLKKRDGDAIVVDGTLDGTGILQVDSAS